MDVLARNNVHLSGRGERAMVFAHGFGCDQNMWRFVAPEFESDFKVVLFDHVGAGGSDLSAYDKAKYSTLHGYADDLVEIGSELGLKDAVFVGHSVSAMIGVLASLKAPDLFGRMVLVGPSARYIDDGDYVGGFSEKQIAELLEFLEDNHMGWSAAMAPSIMGNPDRPGTRRGIDQQLLPDRSGDRKGVCAGHLHVRQQGRSLQGHGSDPDPSVQRGHHRLGGSRQVRAIAAFRAARSSFSRPPGTAQT